MTATMAVVDDQRVGRIVRALRHRLGWRQVDLARRPKCSQRTISRAEGGHLPSVIVLRRILAALDANLVVDVRWRAGALDRLLDEAHASLIGILVGLLEAWGWQVRVEFTYSEFGERGSIDVLAFWPPLGILLVVEARTDLAAAEATLRKLDEKVRLVPDLVRERLGWDVRSVAWLLVMPDTSTLRRRVERHGALFKRVFPARGVAVRRWLREPTGPLAGLWFLSPRQPLTGIQKRGGRERVRTGNRQSSSHQAAG